MFLWPCSVVFTNRLDVLLQNLIFSQLLSFFLSPGVFTFLSLSHPQNPQDTEVAGTTGHIGTMFHEIRNKLHPRGGHGLPVLP